MKPIHVSIVLDRNTSLEDLKNSIPIDIPIEFSVLSVYPMIKMYSSVVVGTILYISGTSGLKKGP